MPRMTQFSHAEDVSVVVNYMARIIAGCLRLRRLEITPYGMRTKVVASFERSKQTRDRRHPMYDQTIITPRLDWRRNFNDRGPEQYFCAATIRL